MTQDVYSGLILSTPVSEFGDRGSVDGRADKDLVDGFEVEIWFLP